MIKSVINHWHSHKYILLTDASDKSHDKHTGFLSNLVFELGAWLLAWVWSFVILTSFFFLLGIPVNRHSVLFSFLLTIPYIIFVFKKHSSERLGLRIVLGAIGLIYIPISCLVLANNFYDLSYDGQAYHQETIIALKEGWNPVYEKLTPEANPDISFQKLLNSYPKVSEIIQSGIYSFTERIETGKSINFIYAFVAFTFSLSLFLRMRFINFFVGFVASLLLIISPVTIVQSLSFYLDLHVYYLLIISFSSLGIFYLTHKNHYLIPFIFSLSLLWTTKITGIAISGVLVASYLIFVWYTEKIWVFFKVVQAVLLASIASFLIIGIHPYLTNLLRFGHPFYPTMGRGSSDYVQVNVPENLVNAVSPVRFFASAFSETSGVRGTGKFSIIKPPFTYSQEEINRYFSNNTIGAFGPLFSGILIVTLFGVLLVGFERNNKRAKRSFLFFITVLFLSCFIVPVSSYARFVPQFWIIPTIAFLYLTSNKSFLIKVFGLTVLFLMTMNLYLIGQRYVMFNFQNSKEIRNELSLLRKKGNLSDLKIIFGEFRSNRIRFNEARINYREISPSECHLQSSQRVLSAFLPDSDIRICN